MRTIGVEARREQAVFDFLNDNHGSKLLSEGINFAIIQTGGMTKSQVQGHLIASLLTLGLWLFPFWVIAMLRAPRTVLVYVHADGKIEYSQLDN